MSRATNDEVTKALAKARTTVQILGVVPFDIDWDEVCAEWRRAGAHPEIRVRCESDNVLFTRSFVSDSATAAERTTYREMRVIRDHALELPQLVREIAKWEPNEREEKTMVELIHLNSPLSVARIDDRYFAQLTVPGHEGPVTEIIDGDPLWEMARDALAYTLDAEGGEKFSAVPGTELLEIFDHEGVPRGVFPRNSFYDTDYTQLVVWALIIDRQGRLLIHRRSDNAKDNREMWDKSVGGHVDPLEHADTSHAAVREVIEELFVNELDEDPDFRPFEITDSDVIYLGEWRPDVRGRHLFKEAVRYRSQWYFLKLRSHPRVYSPRTMPDGKVRRLRVQVDAFVFVASEAVTEERLNKLENSAFKLISMNDLKSAMDLAQAGKAVPGFDASRDVPLFSPDLVNIMTGDLRDEVIEFAELVRRYATNG